MASFNNDEKHIASMELQVPSAVIITSGTGIPYWKQHFSHKKKETSNSAETNLYNRCIKLLLWAEFCDGTLIYVGNSKDSKGNLTIKFTFDFPNADCEFLFQMEWESLIKIVSK